jgi:hypothetical protein
MKKLSDAQRKKLAAEGKIFPSGQTGSMNGKVVKAKNTKIGEAKKPKKTNKSK